MVVNREHLRFLLAVVKMLVPTILCTFPLLGCVVPSLPPFITVEEFVAMNKDPAALQFLSRSVIPLLLFLFLPTLLPALDAL